MTTVAEMYTEETKQMCQSCGHVDEDTAGVPLYECRECSLVFSKNNGMGKGHTCPDCTNKFGTRIADDCCVECEEGELEDTTVFVCNECGEEFESATEAIEHYDSDHDEEAN